MSKRVIIYVVSFILGVGVSLGVVAMVHFNKKVHHETSATTYRAVATICKTTDDENFCHKVLDNVNSTNPKDYINTAIKSAVNEVKRALNVTDSVLDTEGNKTMRRMAIDDCKDLLQFAIDELQDSMSIVGDPSIKLVPNKSADLKNWLSAVISYQQTCLDGLESEENLLQAIKANGIQDASKLTSMALAIVSEITPVLEAFHLNIKDNNLGSRRLLGMGDNEYPTWFSVADRKLLAKQESGRIKPNAIVAKDGSGQYKTIGEALAAYPKNYRGRYIIHVKAGIYDEYLKVDKKMKNVFMYGDGPRKSIITGRKSHKAGYSTFETASFSAIGEGFLAKSMGFRNTAGPKGHQAVALRVQSDMSAFFNCRMDGYQDTLYVQTHRQFYRHCVISGTIDFIFGDASAVIQNSLIIVRRPGNNQKNTVTAQGRVDKHEMTGLIIQNCRIVPEKKLLNKRFTIKTYLGRPWKTYSRTVIMESTLEDFIQPEGWLPWNGSMYLDTLYYAEYGNRGIGARTDRRVKWKGFHVIDKNEAAQFTPGIFIQAKDWLPTTGVPCRAGFTK